MFSQQYWRFRGIGEHKASLLQKLNAMLILWGPGDLCRLNLGLWTGTVYRLRLGTSRVNREHTEPCKIALFLVTTTKDIRYMGTRPAANGLSLDALITLFKMCLSTLVCISWSVDGRLVLTRTVLID